MSVEIFHILDWFVYPSTDSLPNYYYFASNAVVVDSRLCHHPLRGVDSVHLRVLLMGTRKQCMVHGLLLTTITGR